MADQIRASTKLKLAGFVKLVNGHKTTPMSYSEAITLSEDLKAALEKCEKAHDEAIANCVDDKAVEVQETAQEPIDALAFKLKSRLHDIIQKIQPPSSAPKPTPVSTHLPNIELPLFDGSFTNWLSFKDLFQSMVGRHPTLAPSQKLQYLMTKLSAEPSNLIQSLALSDANYTVAWKLLEDRYDNNREIVFSWMDKLFDQPKLQSESASGLQSLLDNTNSCIRALEALKLDVKSWDPMLICILLRKVDANTRCEWAFRRTGTTVPTFAMFATFITDWARSLAAKGAVKSTPPAQQQQKKKPDTRVKSHTATSEPTCGICKDPHIVYRCPKLTQKAPKDRKNLVRSCHLCFNCLSGKHRVEKCPSQVRCRNCGKMHHTLLHEDNRPQPHTQSRPQDQTPPSDEVHSNMATSTVKTQVLLSTAVVLVEDEHGVKQPCRAFLDSGSEASFISEACVRRLGLQRTHSKISVSGISGTSVGSTHGKVQAGLHSQQQVYPPVIMDLLILAKVTGELPRFHCERKQWSHLNGLFLADTEYHKPSSIDILVGADFYGNVILGGQRAAPTPDAPFAQETIFGWVLCGRVPLEAVHTIRVHHAGTEMDILRRFWEVEEPPRSRILTQEEKDCESHFIKNFSRDKTGRFIAAIPFTNKREALGASKHTAIRRFHHTERRLQRQPEYKQPYLDFMREYQQLGHMELVPVHERIERFGATFYLPHHLVVNESSTTTKLRVVFDGSVKSSTSLSLNDAMMVGATLQDELYLQLLRFRSHLIVVKADIAKMFRQFRLSKSDADMHRILWRETPEAPLEEFRLTTITYGTACAPNLSTRCLQQLAHDVKDEYPKASYALLNDTYVDDVMTGTPTSEEAITLYQELGAATATAGLELRKWSSNSTEVLKAIPAPLRETDPHSFDDNPDIKALGIHWHPSSDTFNFHHIPVSDCPTLTKRVLLSDLARVFDPLGLITCITVRAKIILQHLWRDDVGWDDPAPDFVLQQWNEYQQDMMKIPDLNFPRCLIQAQPTHMELHGFSDASEVAYAAVVYLRSFFEDGSIHVRLITSKSKVAPVRQVSVPRLELMGALMLAELITQVQEALHLDAKLTLWTDFTITLRWISAQSKRWKTFIANRVALIQAATPIECWRHIPGKENPADLPSRGVPVEEVISTTMWLSGPPFLSQPGLPTFVTPSIASDVQDEERKVPVLAHPASLGFSILEKYSSLTRLKRVTAYMFRFIHNCKPSNATSRRTGILSPAEIHDALTYWIRLTQRQYFKAEIKALTSPAEFESLRGKKYAVPSRSQLRSLHPFLDDKGLLRLSGRLQHANFHDERRHQLILPAKCHLTDLIIYHAHCQTLHGGFQLTWSYILSLYWIPSGRNKVRHFVRSCVICRRYRQRTAEQLMGSLPPSRVTQSRPFSHTGVDLAGPFTLKNPVGRVPTTYKGYLCIFVCMATKALYLEAVSSQTTEDFLATFRRFAAHIGAPTHMYSDQGKNFIGAEKELKRLIRSWNSSPLVADTLASQSITWHFNPPRNAHAGGLWEAAVKSCKYHLRRIVGQAVLTFEQFSTILCQIESILNSRPLLPNSSDPDDLTALTPGHFLNLHPILPIPDEDLTHLPINRLNLYQKQQQRVQHFWKVWSRDYLNTLQERNKWWWDRPDLKEGDLVLRIEESAPEAWKMARVIKIHPGQDGKVRTVTIKFITDYLVDGKDPTVHIQQRPIVKLIPLFDPETN